MRRVYALLAVLGLVVPFYFFARFIAANGLDLSLFLSQLFANDISTFFAVDLFIATVVFWVFVAHENHRLPVRHRWIAAIAALLVGLSFALPLYLYWREGAQLRGSVPYG